MQTVGVGTPGQSEFCFRGVGAVEGKRGLGHSYGTSCSRKPQSTASSRRHSPGVLRESCSHRGRPYYLQIFLRQRKYLQIEVPEAVCIPGAQPGLACSAHTITADALGAWEEPAWCQVRRLRAGLLCAFSGRSSALPSRRSWLQPAPPCQDPGLGPLGGEGLG